MISIMGNYTCVEEYSSNEYKKIELVEKNEKLFVRKQFFQHDNKAIYEWLKMRAYPHFPKIYEINNMENGFEIIEEYLDGELLRDLIPIDDIHVVGRYAYQLSEALLFLHKRKIVHRDLKPDNIIVVNGHIKVIDFDIAKNINKEKKMDTHVLGSLGYAAPEQYGFSYSSQQSDIYAFGNVLNEMITGCLVNEQLTDSQYEGVVKKCTQLDPDQRYHSVEPLQKDLKQAIANRSKYTLPGFRTGKTFNRILASLAYLFIIWFLIIIKVSEAKNIQDVLYTKTMVAYIFLLPIIMFTNYLDIKRFNPMKRFRFIGNIILGIALFFTGCFVIMIIFSFVC